MGGVGGGREGVRHPGCFGLIRGGVARGAQGGDGEGGVRGGGLGWAGWFVLSGYAIG